MRPDHPRDEFSGALGWVLAPIFLAGRRRAARLVADLADVRPGDTVVDVGCGAGQATLEAARRGADALGVDPSTAMLRTARWAARREGQARFVDATAEHLPVEDATRTVVWSVSAAHHWPDVLAGLEEARRVLAPGGRLVVLEMATHRSWSFKAHHGLTPESAQRLAGQVAAAGFADVEVTEHRTGRGRWLAVTGTVAA
ncbi:MAG TPA: class I SAM-dependent methyltransferase [Actinomycetales bacterium]|nr:class I SAM-dependent methyltransferase [Actinomycetales bacterium]